MLKNPLYSFIYHRVRNHVSKLIKARKEVEASEDVEQAEAHHDRTMTEDEDNEDEQDEDVDLEDPATVAQDGG